MHSKWRRFLPKRTSIVLPDGGRLSTIRSVQECEAFITKLKTAGEPRDKDKRVEYYKALIIAQTPRAAVAQLEMDKHKRGYHDREKRLYELIDFNDSFVSLVLATKRTQLPGLAEQLKSEMTQFCRRLTTPMFTDTQYDAIVRGLSREIAVYRGAIEVGYDAQMTSRTDDAFGIDMVVTRRDGGKALNIDCKTPPAFRHRLEDMAKDGHITDMQVATADEVGFITTEHSRDNERVNVTLFCILPDRLGDIHDFSFDDPSLLGHQLKFMFSTIR